MSKSYLAPLATLLLWTGLTFGQVKELPPAQVPDKPKDATIIPVPPRPKDTPASTVPEKPNETPATPEKSKEAPATRLPDKTPEPPRPAHFWDGIKPSLLDACPRQMQPFTADFDYVLWSIAAPHDRIPIASTDVLGNPNAVVLNSLGNPEHEKKGPASGARLA